MLGFSMIRVFRSSFGGILQNGMCGHVFFSPSLAGSSLV